MTKTASTPTRNLRGFRKVAAYVRESAEIFHEAQRMRDEFYRRYPHMVE